MYQLCRGEYVSEFKTQSQCYCNQGGQTTIISLKNVPVKETDWELGGNFGKLFPTFRKVDSSVGIGVRKFYS